MKTILELRAERKELVDGAEALLAKAEAENRDLTDEEQTAFDAAMEKAEKMGGDIERRESLEKAQANLQASAGRVTKPQPVDRPNFGLDASGNVIVPRREGSMRAFDNSKEGELSAYRAGRWIRAQIFGSLKDQQWCRENGLGFQAAQSEGVNSAGGYLVPVELERAIIDLREEYGTFRRECRVIPMGSDTIQIPRRTGGLTAYFTAESATPSESNKSWDQVQLTAKKLMTLTRYSSELDEDAYISIADDLASEIAYAFATKEDACGWNGDGTSTYGGIYGLVTNFTANYASLAGGVQAASGIDTFAEITVATLTTLMAALPKYAMRNAKWYCSKPCNDIVFNGLKAAGGGNTITTLEGSPQERFLGYPIVVDQSLPTSTGDLSNAVMLFFGDLSMASTMGSRRGIRVQLSTERYFDSDEIGIKGTERFDINNHDIGDASTAGPLVALIGN